MRKIRLTREEKIGAENIKEGNRAVTFTGTNEIMYKANFHSRTAINILKPIFRFKAKNEDELYKNIYDFDWEQYLGIKNTFAVDPTVFSTRFKHSQYTALKTKDAIVDQFRNKFGRRPYIDTDDPDVLLNLHISETDCTISLNSSGEPLYKRGYRVATNEAPLNEVMAAGLISLSGWQPGTNLVDLMCGSGTILIEAALIANKVPPGIFRKAFGFEKWPDYDREKFLDISSEEDDTPAITQGKFLGIDISNNAINIARNNAKNAFLHSKIEFINDDFFNFKNELENGVIISNPPYGERIKPEKIDELYINLGSTLKHKYPNFSAWILSSNFDAMKKIGLHPEKKIKLLNASLDCTFNKFTIYEGSKKGKNLV